MKSKINNNLFTATLICIQFTVQVMAIKHSLGTEEEKRKMNH